MVQTLGEEWLRAECARALPVMHQLDRGHDIVSAFRTGDEGSVVRVLELALYLKHLAKCPGFDEVVPQLRNDLESTRLQLAYAYRIHLHGPQVRLEPPAVGGRKGDISFRWAGRDYQVECYARRRKPDPLQDFFSFSLGRILSAGTCQARKLRLLVRFNRAPGDQERLALEAKVQELCRAVQPSGRAEWADALATVEIHDISEEPELDFLPSGLPNDNGPYSDARAIISGSDVPVADLTPPLRQRLLRANGTRLLVWYPPGPPQGHRERMSDLADRIERKLAQTRSESGRARRLVIVQLERGREREVWHQALLRGVAARIRRHVDVAGMLVCAHVRGPKDRFRYIGTIFEGSVQDQLPDAIMRWAKDTDYRRDMFADWNR